MKMYNVRFCGNCPKIHVEPIGQDCVAFKHQHSPFAEGLNLIIQGTDDVGICVQAGAAMPEQYKPSTVLHPVLMRVDQEQKVTKDARTDVEQDVEPQRYATEVIREKHEVAAASLAEMENIAVTEETMLEATLQYRSGQTKAHLSPRYYDLGAMGSFAACKSWSNAVRTFVSLAPRAFFGSVSIEVDVDELKAMKSCVIDNWIEYGTGVLRLEYKTNIVLKVIEFCKKHAEIRNSNKKLGHENPKDFHSEFVKENQSILIDLLSAACDMQIRSLLDVTSETVADMINGKTAEVIHKMFNLKEDLTFKEMEVVLRYDEFCAVLRDAQKDDYEAHILVRGLTEPPPPPSLPPPPPPPFPLVGMYGNLVPAVLESPQSPFKGNNWSPRPVDPSLNRNPARRNNYGPRPISNAGRRDHHGSRSPTPRDVHMQHQMGPPPRPPFIQPPFMPPPLRPSPMGYEMGPYYVPTLPEPYRSGAPTLPHGAPGTMFMPRMDSPFQDPILKQIEYYFSDDNLAKDNFLRSHMDSEGWVSLTVIAGFHRVSIVFFSLLSFSFEYSSDDADLSCHVQQLTEDIQAIVNSLKNSSIVELLDDKMRRRNDWRKWILTGSQSESYI
ncbi:la-related protein 1C-like protein [Tanacetum coccineum]